MKRPLGAALALTLGLLAMPAAHAQPADDLGAARARLDSLLDRSYPALEALYRDIHAHPELAGQETRTAALLAERLRAAGFEVTEGVGGTGIVGLFHNGEGPTVLVRADMDALPMEEKTGLPYASRVMQDFQGGQSYVAHMCGHDLHMAWWIGAAEALVAMKDRWQGTLVFMGQPAEETGAGARAMIADGLFERFPRPDFALAGHVNNLSAGTIELRSGPAAAGSDTFEVTFHGQGGHGSMPSATIDPIVMGARFVTDVQTVISREKDAAAFGVVTVGAFQSGTVANIIPDDAVLKVNTRFYSPEVRSLVSDGITRTARAVASMARAGEPTIERTHGMAALVNDAGMARRADAVLRPLYGDAVQFLTPDAPPVPASEDFSEVSAVVPTLFFAIGGYDPQAIAQAKAEGRPVPVNHSPYFAPIPGPTIRTGVSAIVMSILGGVGAAAGESAAK